MKNMNPALIRNVVCVLSFSFLFCSTQREKSVKPLKTDIDARLLITELERNLPELMHQAMIPGLSIAVVRDSSILWQQGFGVKNVDNQELVTAQTVFEAASLSKPVFAYAVLKMVERGELVLDQPLVNYVSESYLQEKFLGEEITDTRFRKITTHRVLTHTAGFPNWRGRQALTIQFEPGEKFSYSGEGFGLLQRVVEKITGLSLNEFMQREVFTPLEMRNSSYVWRDDYEQNAATPHNLLRKVAKKGKPKQGHGAATLHTTAEDFAKFMLALMNSYGLRESTIDSMLTPQIIVAPEESTAVFWGLGIGLEETPHGTAFWHWGDNYNFRCFALGFKTPRIGFVYFTNSYFGLTIRKNIVDLALGGEHPVLTSSLVADYGEVEAPGIPFLRTLVEQGIDSALAIFQELSQQSVPQEILPEPVMNGLGYELLRSEQVREAIEIFKLNVTLFPESSNVYDSLGEAYLKNGDKALAISNYEKSLELNPDNTNAVEQLKKIRGK